MGRRSRGDQFGLPFCRPGIKRRGRRTFFPGAFGVCSEFGFKKSFFGRQPGVGFGRPAGLQAAQGSSMLFPARPRLFAVSRSGLGPVGFASRVALKKSSFGRRPGFGFGRPSGFQAAQGSSMFFPAQTRLFAVSRSGLGPVVFYSRFILQKSSFGGGVPSRCPCFISFMSLVSALAFGCSAAH